MKQKKVLIALIACLYFTQLSAQRGQNNRIIENNGLKGNLNVHDPVMIKQRDTYYIFSTGMNIKTSVDKINWTNSGSVFGRDSMAWWHDDIKERVGLWAPDIHYSNGKYHLYYSVSAWMNFNSGVGYATNTTLDKSDPDYKWVDQGEVIDFKNGGEGVNVIDPNIFWDADGKEWLLYGSYKAGLRMVELNPATGKLFTEKPEITTLTTSLGEGVFLIKNKDYYYIFASRGRCCAGDSSTYQVVMGRSKNIKGPYLNKEGESWVNNKYSLLLAGDSTEPGRGHNGFFTEGDSTFFVYHAYTKAFNGASLLNIKPLYIDEQGWPTLDASKKLFKREEFFGKPANTFTNPLLPSGADPFSFYKDGYFYYTHTTGNRIVLYKAKDLTELKTAERKVIYTPPQGTSYSRELWAPEIHFINNKWYAYFAADDGKNDNHRMYVIENASADPLQSEWVFKGQVGDTSNKWAIDGNVFTYKNQLYMIWSGWEGNTNGQQNIYIAAMENPWTISGKRVLISSPTYEWEKYGALHDAVNPPQVNVNEGPQFLLHGKQLFIVYSASGCWTDMYALGLLTFTGKGKLTDASSWKKSPQPVFNQSKENGVYAPGHNSFFKSPDGKEDWILYHANSQPGQGCGRFRSPRAQRFSWNKDGTPNFGVPVKENTLVVKPSGSR